MHRITNSRDLEDLQTQVVLLGRREAPSLSARVAAQ